MKEQLIVAKGLLEELNELKGKLHRLDDFIISDEYALISPRQQALLTDQQKIMQHYQTILEERIVDLKCEWNELQQQRRS